MGVIGQRIHFLVLNLCLVLGVGLLGFAHSLPRMGGPDLQGFALPDGTLPQLCQTADPDKGSAQGAHCPACHLVAHLPPPAPAMQAIWALVPLPIRGPDRVQVKGTPFAAAPPAARAPPSLIM